MLILYISFMFETVVTSHNIIGRRIFLCGRRCQANFRTMNKDFIQDTKPLYNVNKKTGEMLKSKELIRKNKSEDLHDEIKTKNDFSNENKSEDFHNKKTESVEIKTKSVFTNEKIKNSNILFWNSVFEFKFHLSTHYDLINRYEEISILKDLEKSILKLFFPIQVFTMSINKDKEILKNKIFKFDKKIFYKIEDLRKKVDNFSYEKNLISKVNDYMNESEIRIIYKNYIEEDKYYLSFKILPDILNVLEFTDPFSWAEFFHDCDSVDLFLSCFFFIQKSYLINDKMRENIIFTDSDLKDMKIFIFNLKNTIFKDFDFESLLTFEYKKMNREEPVDHNFGFESSSNILFYTLKTIMTNKSVDLSGDINSEKEISIFEKLFKNKIHLNYQTCLTTRKFVEDFLYEDKNLTKENIKKIMDLYDMIFVINCSKYDTLDYSNVGFFIINFYQNICESISTENRNFFYNFLEICSNFRKFDSLNLNFNLNHKKIDSLIHLSMIIISLSIDETKIIETFLRNLNQDIISCFYLFYGKNGVSSSLCSVSSTEISIDNHRLFHFYLQNILEKYQIFDKNIYENIEILSSLHENSNLFNIFTVRNKFNVEEILKNLKNIGFFESCSLENKEKLRKILKKIYGNQKFE